MGWVEERDPPYELLTLNSEPWRPSQKPLSPCTQGERGWGEGVIFFEYSRPPTPLSPEYRGEGEFESSAVRLTAGASQRLADIGFGYIVEQRHFAETFGQYEAQASGKVFLIAAHGRDEIVHRPSLRGDR